MPLITFLYPQKTLENQIFSVFRKYRKKPVEQHELQINVPTEGFLYDGSIDR